MRTNAILVGLTLFGLGLMPLAPAQEPGAGSKKPNAAQDRATLNGSVWQGTWLSLSEQSSGYVYAAELELKIAVNNTAEGRITWTLKKTPANSPLEGKIGKTAVEFVKGTYDPQSRNLVIDGYKKDDPDEIIEFDQYRLILANNDRVLGGITASHDTWQGLMSLTTKKPN